MLRSNGGVTITTFEYRTLVKHKKYKIRVTSEEKKIDKVFTSVGHFEFFLNTTIRPLDLIATAYLSRDNGRSFDEENGIRII